MTICLVITLCRRLIISLIVEHCRHTMHPRHGVTAILFYLLDVLPSVLNTAIRHADNEVFGVRNIIAYSTNNGVAYAIEH